MAVVVEDSAPRVAGAGPASPLLLAVDGNSLLHRAFHAGQAGRAGEPGEGLTDDAGRPIWALKGMISFLASAASRLTPDALVIGFDSPLTSVRRDTYPQYKAHREPKPDDLCEQLDAAPELLTAAGFCVVTPDGYEADDVLASAARTASAAGYRATLMTSDRDAFALISDSTSVLRVLNGGIDLSPVITPEKLPSICGVTPSQYRDLAALRGDTSDNLPGVPGIGVKTAAVLLGAFGTLDAVWSLLETGREAEVAEAIGPAMAARLTEARSRVDVERNRRLMAMRDDLELPPLGHMRLPMDPITLQTALRDRQIFLGPSLWALVGASPPAWMAERQGRWAVLDDDSPASPDRDGWDAQEPPERRGSGGDPLDPIARAQADRVMRNTDRPRPARARSRYAAGAGQLALF